MPDIKTRVLADTSQAAKTIEDFLSKYNNRVINLRVNAITKGSLAGVTKGLKPIKKMVAEAGKFKVQPMMDSRSVKSVRKGLKELQGAQVRLFKDRETQRKYHETMDRAAAKDANRIADQQTKHYRNNLKERVKDHKQAAAQQAKITEASEKKQAKISEQIQEQSDKKKSKKRKAAAKAEAKQAEPKAKSKNAAEQKRSSAKQVNEKAAAARRLKEVESAWAERRKILEAEYAARTKAESKAAEQSIKTNRKKNEQIARDNKKAATAAAAAPPGGGGPSEPPNKTVAKARQEVNKTLKDLDNEIARYDKMLEGPHRDFMNPDAKRALKEERQALRNRRRNARNLRKELLGRPDDTVIDSKLARRVDRHTGRTKTGISDASTVRAENADYVKSAIGTQKARAAEAKAAQKAAEDAAAAERKTERKAFEDRLARHAAEKKEREKAIQERSKQAQKEGWAEYHAAEQRMKRQQKLTQNAADEERAQQKQRNRDAENIRKQAEKDARSIYNRGNELDRRTGKGGEWAGLLSDKDIAKQKKLVSDTLELDKKLATLRNATAGRNVTAAEYQEMERLGAAISNNNALMKHYDKTNQSHIKTAKAELKVQEQNQKAWDKQAETYRKQAVTNARNIQSMSRTFSNNTGRGGAWENMLTEQQRQSWQKQMASATQARQELARLNTQTQGRNVTQSQADEYKKWATQLNTAKTNLQGLTKVYTDHVKALNGPQNAAIFYDKLAAKMSDYNAKFGHNLQRNQRLMDQFNTLQMRANNGDFANIGEANRQWATFRTEARKAGVEIDSFGSKLQRTFGSRVRSATAGMGVYMIQSALRGIVENAKEVDTAMTELKKVTTGTDKTYEDFLTNAGTRAQTLGATLQETVSATADFGRLGYNIEDATKLADNALIYQNVGDDIESIDEASKALISTMQGLIKALVKQGELLEHP